MILIALLVVGLVYEQTATRLAARKFPAPGNLIDVGGRRIHILCKGSSSPTVLMIPSGLGNVLQYQHAQNQLANSFRTCAIDRAGFGWSDTSDLPQDANSMEWDLENSIAKAELPAPYIVVASSAGGLTADLFIRKHAAQVTGVVWVDALTGDMIPHITQLHRLESAACMASTASWFGLPRLFDFLHIRDDNSADSELKAALTYKHSTFAAACSLTKNFSTSAAQIKNAPARSSSIHSIVLVHGVPTGLYPYATPHELEDLDKQWLPLQRELAASFTNQSLNIVEGSGHLIANERPDVIVRSVEQLAQLQSR